MRYSLSKFSFLSPLPNLLQDKILYFNIAKCSNMICFDQVGKSFLKEALVNDNFLKSLNLKTVITQFEVSHPCHMMTKIGNEHTSICGECMTIIRLLQQN